MAAWSGRIQPGRNRTVGMSDLNPGQTGDYLNKEGLS
jgi:hypothetical protein